MSEANLIDHIVTYFRSLWSCYLWHHHDWTCAAAEGLPATTEQLANGIDGFYDYAKMYCKRCGKESQISRLTRERAKHERHATDGGRGGS